MTAFDWATYGERSRSLLAKLEELYAIDLVLEGLRGIDWSNKPQDHDLDYEAGWGRDYNEQITIHLGTSHPFTVDVYKYKEPGKVDLRFIWTEPDKHDYSFVDSAPQKAADWAAGIRDTFYDTVEPLTRVDSSSYIDAQRVLARAGFALDAIPTDFAYLSQSDWKGGAADTFFRLFYWRFADIRENHVWGIDQMARLIEQSKAVNDVGQLALLDLVAKADDLVDEQLQSRQSNWQSLGSKTKTATAVASGGATVVAGAAVKYGKVAGPFTILAGALTVLASIPGDVQQPVDLEGTGADDISTVWLGALDDLVVAIDRMYATVGDECGKVEGWVENLKQVVRGLDVGTGGPTPPVNDWRPIHAGIRVGNDRGFHHESSGRAQ